jgi:hypothetical protein
MPEFPQSVIVVRWPLGWVAHLRFKNSKLDEDVSASSRYFLDNKIDKFFWEGKYETTYRKF